MLPGRRVHFPDRCPFLFLVHAVLGDIAVGADGHIQLPAVRAGDDVLGPVVVQRPARQLADRLARAVQRGGAFLVLEAQQAIGVGHIQVIADQGHAERRVEVLEEHRAGFRHAILVGIAQQGDAVGARYASAGLGHDLLHHPATDALAVVGFLRCVGFRDQYVAIGQHIEPARVIQATGEGDHLGALGRLGLAAIGPADGRGDVHRGDQGLVRFRQLRRRAAAVGDLEPGGFAAGSQAGGDGQQDGKAQGGHGLTPWDRS